MDTNLNLLQTGKTIDTFSSYQASAKGITKNGKTSFSYGAPPKVINSLISADNGMLYVLSQMKADNEDNDTRAKNSVIDIYNMGSSGYVGSLYVPDEAGKRMIAFKVTDGELLAIYTNKLKQFRINSLLQ